MLNRTLPSMVESAVCTSSFLTVADNETLLVMDVEEYDVPGSPPMNPLAGDRSND